MSLQVWLPLNGNLNNQGVGTTTISGTATYTTNRSKVVPNSLNTSNLININVPSIADKKICTFAFWAYVESASVTTNWTLVARMNDKGTNSGSNMRFEVCPKTYNNGVYCFSNHNNANYGLSNGVITSPVGGYYDQWVHFCFTSDGKTFTRYMNGKKIGTCDYNGQAVFSGDFVLANNHLCLKQDVRIYDHCLSQKEVKELSKGLCLHYKLSRGGENLLKNSSEKSWSYSGTNYSDSNFGQETITPAPDSHYTMSFDVKASVSSNNAFQTYLYNNNSGRQCDKVIVYKNGTKLQETTNADGYSGKLPVTTDWVHYEIVRHFNTNATALTKQNVFRIMGNSGEITIYIKNAKIEEGSISTPWIPNKSDTLYSQLGYNNIEPDCSGYGNNGTKVGTHTYSNDTPRYEGCTFIPSGGVFGSRKFPDNIDSITLSAWVKASNITSQSIVGNWESGGCGIYTNSSKKAVFEYFDGSTYKTCIGTTTLSNDTWYFITGVFSYADKKSYIYVNGVLETQVTISTYIRIGGATNVPMSIGNPSATSVSEITNCYVSDARVYATSLSAEDIKSLYDTPISIDNDKNLHCLELKQTDNQTSFCKSGIAKMELLPIPIITEKCAGNNYTKNLKIWSNGSQLKLNDVHKIRIVFRSRGDGTPTSSKCSSIGCIMWENSWKWSASPILWTSGTAYENIGKIIDYTGSLTINSTMTSTTTSIPISLYWIIQNGWANGNDGQTHDLYYYKYWNNTTGEIYAEGGTLEYDKITTNDFIEN